jgi:exopolysaccharide biosynthesis polyprenyl glycosylphosphotransferase
VPKELQARWVALLCGDLFATLLIPYIVVALISAADEQLKTTPFYVAGALLAALWLTALYFEDLYAIDIPLPRSQVAIRLVGAGGAAFLMFIAATRFSPHLELDINSQILLAAVAGVALTIWRMSLAFSTRQKVGVVVLGTSECAVEMARVVKQNQHLGYRLLGYVDCHEKEPTQRLNGAPVLRVSSLRHFPQRKATNLAVVSCGAKDSFSPMELLQWRIEGTKVIDCDSFYERLTGKLRVASVQQSWLAFAPGFDRSSTALRLKRTLDFIGAFALLVACSPVCVLCAVAIRLESRGRIIYSQERAGMAGKNFRIYKFRSMRDRAENETGPVWCQVDDPRVTRVGRILRRFRIDEIPQLVNVLNGEMSLVGPRPERAEMTAELSKLIPLYEYRLSVPPGLTGWAQICLPYGASIDEARDKLCYDLYYVKNWSVTLDLQILLQSIKVVLFGRGAR